MQLKVIGSNSSGNGYLLVGEKETLLIECGVHIRKIKKALNFQLRNVHCLVSHSHGDHAKYLGDVMDAGLKVHASYETLKAKDRATHHRAGVMVPNKLYLLGEFKVKPFEVEHDVPCFGFIIEHPECGRLVFLTDTAFSKYVFPGLNNMIVEANHDLEIIDNNGTPGFLRDRIIGSHMNLQTCKDLLLANDLSQVNNIVLIHLSDTNSDARRFKREVEQITGKTVTIATEGLEMPFNKTPF